MEVDDIISYHDLVTEEKAALQKGMNYGVGKKYSIFLMSLRENAPYADALDEVTRMLTYEGHDEPQRRDGPNPKEVDQLLTTLKGSWHARRTDPLPDFDLSPASPAFLMRPERTNALVRSLY
jgi:hypothetical protein